MTMAKRKLSTGGNIYFTLDNYGRKKANLFFPGGDIDIADDGGGVDDIGDGVEGDTTDPELNFGQKLKKFGQENGDLITDTLGGLGLGIGYASQRRYNRKHNLLKAAGVTNYRGKYTFGNGGNLFDKGGDIAGGITQGLESAGSIAALTAQNASIADTSELEGAIQDKANVQVSAGSNDDLMSEWASRGPELKHVSWKDVRGQSAGKSFGNIMSAGAAGAKAGMKAGPIGAVAGAVGGIFSSTFGAIAGRRKAKKKAKKLNAAIDAANERNLASFEQRAENIDTNNDLTAMRNYAALGGPLSMYSPYVFGVQGPLEYGLMMDDLDIKQQKADNAGESSSSGLTFGKGGGIHINPKNKGKLTATSKRTGKSFSELAHSKNPLTRKRAIFALNARHWKHGKKHAFGGDLESNGANWDLGFTSIGNGGTHEMNPYEGVQMGTDSKGIPNLVEQGEIVYNDYVFSNRLNATPNLLQAYNLPKKYKGMTFSDIAAKISGETKERPNDPISQKGYEDQMERLIQAQEYVRQAQQQEQAIQQAALMQQAQQYAAQQQQMAQQQAYQNALAQQAYNNQQLGAMQGMVSPEEPQQFAGGGFKARRQARLDAIDEAKANGTYVSSREKWNAPAWQSEPDEYQQGSYGMHGMRQRMANRKQARLDRMEARGKGESDRYNRVYNTRQATLELLNDSEPHVNPVLGTPKAPTNNETADNNSTYMTPRGDMVISPWGGTPYATYEGRYGDFNNFYEDMSDILAWERQRGEELEGLENIRRAVPSPLGLPFLSPAWWDRYNFEKGQRKKKEETQWPPKYGCGGGLKFACGGKKFSHGGKRGRLFSGDDTGSQELGSEDKLSLMDWLNTNGLTLNSPDILRNYWQYYSSGNSATPATPAQPLSADMSDKEWEGPESYLYNNAFSGNVGDVISAYANNPTAPVTPASTSKLPEWYTKILKEGNNQQIGELLKMMGSNDPKVQQYLKENYPGYEDYKNSLQSLYKEDKPYPTWMRYAPAVGSALGLGLSTFWKPNMDYANKIQAAADAAGQFERVGWNPVGNYLQYRPFDTQFALNQLNSQFGATNRAAINNANGNRATAMANLLASQHNYGNQVGGLFAQALQYNDAQRKATEEFNRATNLANSEGFLKADMANQSARQAAMNSKLQGTVYAQNMKNDLDVGRRNSIASNLTGMFNNLGNIGSENFAFNNLKSNPYLIYGVGLDGKPYYKGNAAK